MNILLIGPRASGKTTLGRLLSERLARPFVDLDDLALAKLRHSSIKTVWQSLGEHTWRDAEVQAFAQAILNANQVIALGGGAPLSPRIQQRIQHEREAQRAVVVYLQCTPAELAHRLRADSHDRPSLTGLDPADEVGQILIQREPTYQSLADLVQRTDEPDAREVATCIERLVTVWEQNRR